MKNSISSVALVGARGGMGRLYAGRCELAGVTVIALDRPLTDAALEAACGRADCVMLSIPVPAMAEVCLRAARFMRPGAILADLCSVKTLPIADMLAAYEGPVVGTHPLFGPGWAEGDDARVAIMPGREDCEADEDALERIWTWTRSMGFSPFRTTPAEHDKAMAYFQGLNFVTTVAYLAPQAGNAHLAPFVTPSFKRRLEAARKLLLEDAELFTILFEANPYSQDVVRNYRNYLNVAAGGDVDLLVQRAAEWWAAQEDDIKE